MRVRMKPNLIGKGEDSRGKAETQHSAVATKQGKLHKGEKLCLQLSRFPESYLFAASARIMRSRGKRGEKRKPSAGMLGKTACPGCLLLLVLGGFLRLEVFLAGIALLAGFPRRMGGHAAPILAFAALSDRLFAAGFLFRGRRLFGTEGNGRER